jgi:hypothetical protein
MHEQEFVPNLEPQISLSSNGHSIENNRDRLYQALQSVSKQDSTPLSMQTPNRQFSMGDQSASTHENQVVRNSGYFMSDNERFSPKKLIKSQLYRQNTVQQAPTDPQIMNFEVASP